MKANSTTLWNKELQKNSNNSKSSINSSKPLKKININVRGGVGVKLLFYKLTIIKLVLIINLDITIKLFASSFSLKLELSGELSYCRKMSITLMITGFRLLPAYKLQAQRSHVILPTLEDNRADPGSDPDVWGVYRHALVLPNWKFQILNIKMYDLVSSCEIPNPRSHQPEIFVCGPASWLNLTCAFLWFKY